MSVFLSLRYPDDARVLIDGKTLTKTQLKWDIVGARRDDPIARFGPSSVRPSERAAAASEDSKDEE